MNLKHFINLEDYYFTINNKGEKPIKKYYSDCNRWQDDLWVKEHLSIGKFTEINIAKIKNYCWILDRFRESSSPPQKGIGTIQELVKYNYFPFEILFIGDNDRDFEAEVKNDYIINGRFEDTIFSIEIVARNIDLDKDKIEDWIIIYDYSTIGSTYSKCYAAIISRNLGKNGVHGKFILKKKLPDSRCG